MVNNEMDSWGIWVKEGRSNASNIEGAGLIMNNE